MPVIPGAAKDPVLSPVNNYFSSNYISCSELTLQKLHQTAPGHVWLDIYRKVLLYSLRMLPNDACRHNRHRSDTLFRWVREKPCPTLHCTPRTSYHINHSSHISCRSSLFPEARAVFSWQSLSTPVHRTCPTMTSEAHPALSRSALPNSSSACRNSSLG